MGGLLYKDFVSIKGKALSITFIVLVILFLVFRVIFSGNYINENFMAVTEAGEMVNMLDVIFLTILPSVLYVFIMLVSFCFNKTVVYDEKNKVRSYMLALPLDKKKYVASKYIFVGILTYVFLSLYYILLVINNAFMSDVERLVNSANLCMAIAVPSMCLVLIMHMVDIPFNLLFGNVKARTFQTIFWLIVGFAVVAFFLFGDLEILDKWDILKLIEWADKHAFELTVVSILSPVISLLLFYLSYRITVFFYERKEGMDE